MERARQLLFASNLPPFVVTQNNSRSPGPRENC